VDAVLATGFANSETVWQLGVTQRRDLPGEVHTQLSSPVFEKYAREADIVITHAGVGTIMSLLDMGIYPIVIPRRAYRNEHVDDHQAQIASLLSELGIGLTLEVGELTRNSIIAASRRSVIPAPNQLS
jgi:UDP-N-acetylglucosamine transferase subunit ALG13